jgi:serpin B
LNAVVVTVSDRLRVRSEPRVSDDSIRYEPVLPLGTELTVLDGPVRASGYTWYKVAPVSFVGLEGPGYGWVALAGTDGEPWLAVAGTPDSDGVGLDGPDVASVDLARANVPRAAADPADARMAAGSLNAFGLDLFRAMLADPELDFGAKNIVFSPASIALALAMARAGARGDTATEMDATLHTTGWEALGPGLNALDQALASRSSTWQDSNGQRELALQIANASYGQRGWTIERGYLDAIAAAFGAGLRLADFATDREAARKTINAWVSDQTRQRIPELLRRPDLTERTRLVLLNAIYLKAEWAMKFYESSTELTPFSRLDGSRVDVQMMHAVSFGTAPAMPYARGNGWQAVELRYLGADGTEPLAMVLILPDDLQAFEARLSSAQLERITAALTVQRGLLAETRPCTGDRALYEGECHPYSVSLFMPRFGIETRADLKAVLDALGMPRAFDRGRADFTGIHVPEGPDDRLFISKVIHQANIDVDEKGTEAAAATAVIGDTAGPGASAQKEIILRLDRPFLFFLRDVETGAVLFMGRVTDPSVPNRN